MGKGTSSVLKIVFALGLVGLFLGITYRALPTSGGEFISYGTVKHFALGLILAGIVAGWALNSGIRGLLKE